MNLSLLSLTLCFSTLLFISPIDAREKMPKAMLQNATKDRFIDIISTHMPKVRIHTLGATDYDPQQMHLALTTDPTALSISWVTGKVVQDPTVYYWPGQHTPQPSNASTTTGLTSTYTAGDFGWTGSIYNAEMTNLIPGQFYSYTVGSPSVNVWSDPVSFKTPVAPGATANLKLAITADQGTIVPLGYAISEAIIQEHFETGHPFDACLISGDISYATIDPPNHEIEWTWDSYMIQVEPYAAVIPFMATVGNHEATPGNKTNATGTYNDIWGAAFQSRFFMPANGNGNLWFSFNIGPVHVASISSEHNYTIGSEQWLWLQNDLQSVDRSVTPWVFVSLHRPIYSSDEDEYGSHCPGGVFAVNLEPLLVQNKVDLVLQGHEHCAERTQAHINGTVITAAVNQGNGTASNTYVNPGAPIYIVQGSSGAVQEESWVTPQPVWSAFRIEDVYGYGIMEITGANLLEYYFVDTQRQIWDQWRIVRQ